MAVFFPALNILFENLLLIFSVTNQIEIFALYTKYKSYL